MIRILHCLDGLDRGGIETMLMNIYRNIDSDSIQFDFLLTNPEHCDYEDEVIEHGGRVFRIPRLLLFKPWRYLRGLNKFFRSHVDQWKIVHSHSTAISTFPLAFAKRYGVPVRIAHSHINQSGGKVRAVQEWVMRHFLPIVCTGKFACSDDAAYYLFGKDIHDVMIIKNAIQVERFVLNDKARMSFRTKLDIDDSTFVVGHVGRFAEQKNHTFLVDVFVEICRLQQKSKLILIGEGPLEQQIKDKVHTMGLDNHVIFVGTVSNVEDYMQAMDVFCFPSLFEGLGMVLVEAQVSGLPCIAAKYNVPREADVTGLVNFMPLEEGAVKWAEKIVEIGKCSRVSHENEVKQAGYDIVANAKKIQDFYIKQYEDNV